MYNLSLPNLCATYSSLATLRLPTVDPYSAEIPGRMHSHTVLCGDLYMSYFAYACKFGLKTSCLPPNFRSYRKSKINII